MPHLPTTPAPTPRPPRLLPPLLRAAHFEPCVAVTAVTTLLAVGLGLGWRSAWVAAAVLSGQLAVGWHNDLVDAARDTAAGRREKPVAGGEVRPATLRRLTPVAAVGALALSAPLGVAALGWHALGLAGGFAHNAGVKATPWSPAPWVVAFGALPAFAWAAAGARAPWWALATGALLGGGAHFTNTLPDLDEDARTGVRGLPHRLGARVSLRVAAMLLGGGAVVVAAGTAEASAAVPIAATVSLVAVLGVLLAGAAGRYRLAFRLTLVAAAVLVISFVSVGALTPEVW